MCSRRAPDLAAASRGIGALSISVTRFHLAWVLSGILAAPVILQEKPEFAELMVIAVIATVSISLPILLLQWGITLAPPLHTAFIISGLPALVLIADIVLGTQLTTAIGISMAVLVAILLLGLKPKR